MHVGLGAMNYGTCADPATAVRVARAAEAAGCESLWTAEHAVLPSPQPEGFPISPDLPWLDSIAGLTLLATATDRIRIASGTIELPMHNPVRLAKQLSSIDVISNGRLIVGLGLGYLDAEFAAIGAEISERGARMDEYLDVLAELWTGHPPRFAGPTIGLSGIDAYPRPIQPGGPPIVLGGGTTPRARRRIITRARGWYLFGIDADRSAAAIATIDEERRRWERPSALGELDITVTPLEPLDSGTLARYQELGVHRVVLMPGAGCSGDRLHDPVPESTILRTIERAAHLM
jgi:probable F420-dependent oxidoreductase